MTRSLSLLILAVAVLTLVTPSSAQQSDFAVKKGFEERAALIKQAIDSAKTLAVLDSLKSAIDTLEVFYAPREKFLDKALFPTSFAETIDGLRTLHALSYDRTYLIQTQGVRIIALEEEVSALSKRLSSMTTERDSLFQELARAKKSLSSLREVVRRLEANLQAKDKLLFAMVDTMFVPYGQDVSRVTEIQKNAIRHKLEKSGVLQHVYENAADNVRFIESTTFQGKDYAAMIDQYQSFSTRWQGLRDKILAVTAAPPPSAVTTPSGKPKTAATGPTTLTIRPAPGAEVDSLMAVWNQKLQGQFWSALQKEFTDKKVPVQAFADGKSFSESIRSYVQMLKASGEDASSFVEEVWKERVDKEWGAALSKDVMLGKTEYQSLDQMVGGLSQKKFDMRFILYSLAVVALAVAIWWFFIRKRSPTPQAQAPRA